MKTGRVIPIRAADANGSERPATKMFLTIGNRRCNLGALAPKIYSAANTYLKDVLWTTLAAAESTARVCYGIELDPKFADLVVQRWQGMSGKQATLDGDGRTFAEITTERTQVTFLQSDCPQQN